MHLPLPLPYSEKFLVLSLPRSRSAWCKHFLSYAGTEVGHDVGTRCESVREFKDKFALLDGACETGAILGWRIILEEMPGLKMVVVRRDPLEVHRSLLHFGVEIPLEDLVLKWILLNKVAELPGVLALEYHSLVDPLVCKELFEFCLDLPFDWQWWEQYHQTKIELDMASRLQELISNRPRIERFKKEIRERTSLLEGAKQCLN
jgi:hypothetical protein